MDGQETTAKFYDDFSVKQLRTGKNLRHYTIAQLLKQKDFGHATKVLEIGCGIGTLTGLLVKLAPKAKITAFDISPKNVEIARSQINSPQVHFLVADAAKPLDINEKFDFIVLADVIEHIPIEYYETLFANLNRFCHADTKIFINIPHPDLIKYLRLTKPESLQIVDQSVLPTILYPYLLKYKLEILEKKDYRIFYKRNDYTYYWLSPQNGKLVDYTQPLPLLPRILRKLLLRLS